MLSGIMLMPFWISRVPAFEMIRNHFKIILILSFFQTFLLYGLFYQGMTMIPGALAAIVVGSSPLTSAIVSHLCMSNDKMTVPKTVSLCLGVSGVMIISISRLPWTSATGFAEFWGVLILLLSTVSSALGNILVARDKAHLDPVCLNSLQIFLGGLFLFLCSLGLEEGPRQPLPWEYYAALFWLSALSAIAFSLWFILLKRPGIKVSELNVWKFIIPVFGAIFSWILLPDESPQLFPVIGMICIAISIVTYNLSSLLSNRYRSL